MPLRRTNVGTLDLSSYKKQSHTYALENQVLAEACSEARAKVRGEISRQTCQILLNQETHQKGEDIGPWIHGRDAAPGLRRCERSDRILQESIRRNGGRPVAGSGRKNHACRRA